MPHTCQGTADKRGRITSNCEDCHWTAYHEGLYQGATSAVKDAANIIINSLREAYNPLDQEDEGKTTQNWKTFRKLSQLVKDAVEPMVKEAGEEFTMAKEKHRGDPNPS